MIAEAPRHGYELMKAIEERTGGGYSPSPGVIYPTLAWLDDMGYAAADIEGSRRSYRVTPEGEAFLAANGPALAELRTRTGTPGRGGRRNAPDAVLAGMDRLKRALMARFARPVEAEAAARIAAIIERAAKAVEDDMGETKIDGPLVRSVASVRTEKAAGYLAQLCKHFAHRVPASHDGDTGSVEFPRGTCRLTAADGVLTMTVETTDPEAVPQLQDVMARHLERFAFREEMTITWAAA